MRINADKQKIHKHFGVIRIYPRSSAAIFFSCYVGSWRDRGGKAAFTKSIAVRVAASALPSRTGTTTLTRAVSLRWPRMNADKRSDTALVKVVVPLRWPRMNADKRG